MIIDGEEEDLLLHSGPPLVNGAVVLPKLADVSPAKTAVSANAWRRSREQKRKVRFEKGRGSGSGDECRLMTRPGAGYLVAFAFRGAAESAG